VLLAGLFLLKLLSPLAPPKPWMPTLPPLPDEQSFTLWGQTCIRDAETGKPLAGLCPHDMRDL
jgi:hypothetical protein